jgi:DNA-binding NarL/FixJ family response regulator
MTTALGRARAAFDRGAWAEACAAFAEANRDAPLGPGDHERHAVASYLTGADDDCERAFAAAHRTALDAGDPADAARCAVLLALCLALRGQMARAGGWLARAGALVEETGDCPAAGYLLVPQLLGALDAGDAGTALDLSQQATRLGKRFGDGDLLTLGTLGQGQSLIRAGDAVAGLARFDEVMVAVTAGEVGPVVTGIAYCAAIIECLRLHELARAAEWTGALTAWCDAQPDLVPYQGQCLVHRSQLQQAVGNWPAARTMAEAAQLRLTDPPHPALGLAHYQLGELHRLTGELDGAEREYRTASRHGYDPMPGLALLELARGTADAAAASIRRALAETGGPIDRPSLLAAAVDIFRATGDFEGAQAAADELTDLAARRASEVLAAMAAHARGTVKLGGGDAVGGLAELRTAARVWQSLHLPYQAARTAVLVGLSCAALGDRTAADLELGNARDAFAALGARPDLERLAALTGETRPPPADAASVAGLSAREREVLGHLAAGRTNREIAEVLVISQHTVRRHVESIFAKLGVTSRAAATSHAYEHGLL